MTSAADAPRRLVPHAEARTKSATSAPPVDRGVDVMCTEGTIPPAESRRRELGDHALRRPAPLPHAFGDADALVAGAGDEEARDLGLAGAQAGDAVAMADDELGRGAGESGHVHELRRAAEAEERVELRARGGDELGVGRAGAPLVARPAEEGAQED